MIISESPKKAYSRFDSCEFGQVFVKRAEPTADAILRIKDSYHGDKLFNAMLIRSGELMYIRPDTLGDLYSKPQLILGSPEGGTCEA